VAFGWPWAGLSRDYKHFFIHLFLGDPSWWVMKTIQLSLQSCQCLSSHVWEVSEKNGSQKYANLVYFGKLLLLALNLKFLHKNCIFWVWAPLTKWSSSTLISTPIWILKKFLMLNILLQFELRVYFQCLLNSIYRMTRKFNLYHDVHHHDIQIWLNFPIFWNNFLSNTIFLHFFF